MVLPFANLSGDPTQDYLVDAVTDSLTTSIARLPGSFVIARNTASTYKGKPTDARAIGEDLGVRYVLEGSVQPESDRVRVNAQLIDTHSGAHFWAEQFDTPRADLLQTQDEIIARLARAMQFQLPAAEAARLRRAPGASANAEDLALQCAVTTVLSGENFGNAADTGYRFCEQALDTDPNNVLAMNILSVRFWAPAALGLSADPLADLKRADELASRSLALDPNYAYGHENRAYILLAQGRPDEAIPEAERALALDPADVDPYANLGFCYLYLGQFEKGLEFLDKAIRLSPHDPALAFWYDGKADAYFGLKQYDQAIEWARRAIAINPNSIPFAHRHLIAALVLTGHAAEAHEALQHYLALPASGPRTLTTWKAVGAQFTKPRSDPRVLEAVGRQIEGLRKAGLQEE